MSTSSAAAYQSGSGGIGGKFRKHPFRRNTAPSTPYDRPASAVRSSTVTAAAAAAREGEKGWLSRIVTNSASRLFSSVFRKRFHQAITAPSPPQPQPPPPEQIPAAPADEGLQLIEDGIRVVGDSASFPIKENGPPGQNLINIPEDDGISDLEQLLKKKTFTRAEFDRLTELLRSRTIEPSTSTPAANSKEDANVAPPQNERKSSKVCEGVSTPGISLMIQEDENASPAEIAKAYMGLRPPKVSPSSLILRSQILQDDVAPENTSTYAMKASEVSTMPRSVVCFSGISEASENGYLTPRTRGRSAIYKMSCSPYFKAQAAQTISSGLLVRDSYTGPSTSSQRTPSSINTGGKQMLKRPSSVLDSDVGSFGPIRRIRQKPSLLSPTKDARMSSREDLHPSGTSSLGKGLLRGSSSLQKPFLIQGRKYASRKLQDAEEGGNTKSHALTSIPQQSSEMATKILQQLDRLVPSPKEKSSELKAISKNESPSKLTHDMLQGHALKSMDRIDSSRFVNVQSSGNIQTKSDLPPANLHKRDKVKDTSSSGVALEVSVKPESYSKGNAIDSAQTSKPVPKMADCAVSGPTASQSKKPAFKITLEDSVEMDEDENIIKDVMSPQASGMEQLPGTTEGKPIKDAISNEPRTNFFQSSVSAPVMQEIDATKASNGSVLADKVGFSFPVAPSQNLSQSSPPSMLAPVPDSSAKQEQASSPLFGFGSGDLLEVTFSSGAIVNDSAGEKIGISVSPAVLPSFKSDRRDKIDKDGDVAKSVENAPSFSLSTSAAMPVFSFGAATTQSMSNGSISLVPFSFSPASHARLSDKQESDITTTIAGVTGSSSLLMSSPAPISSASGLFQFGSASSNAQPSASPSYDKSDSKPSEEKPIKSSPFSFSTASATGTSLFSNTVSGSFSIPVTTFASSSTTTSSDMMKPSLFQNSGSISSSSAISSVSSLSSRLGNESSKSAELSSVSSTTSSSTGLAKLPLFGSTSSKLSASVASPLFSSATSGSTLSPSLSASSSSPATFSTGFSFSTLTQSSTSNLSFGTSQATAAFGSSTGSTFGAPASQPGSGTSEVSSSGPTFGLSGSTSSVFGSSTYGSLAPSAKSASPVFGFSAGPGSSSPEGSSVFAPTASSSLFGTSSQPSTSSVFASSTSSLPTFGSQPSTSLIFGSNSASQPTAPSVFASSFGSTSSAPHSFSFGPTATSGSSSQTFGSSAPTFSFTSAGSTSSPSPAQPLYGMSTPSVFGCVPQGNDQMNMEDSMTDDNNGQAAVPSVPTFGQSSSSPAMQNFVFGAPAQPVFQFGGSQSYTPNVQAFQGTNNPEFPPGGSFSLGSGGGDKSGRRFVKAKRDKHRKR